ncbi:MAG: sigma-70 family RNA polymerase sigma factor [Planctomycetaceae bacterium]
MWPETEQTQELLLGVAADDSEAVNRLMNRHRNAVRDMIALRMDRRMQGRVDASDIVQDVLIEAAGRLKDYLRDPAMPFHLWLRQIAKDRMIDLHRRHHAQRRSVDREQEMAVGGNDDRSSFNMVARLQDAGITPAAAAIKQELEQRFWSAVDQLDDPDREMILMRHAEQLGNGEAAVALGLSPAAAGMRYLRAIRRLRTLLGVELADDPESL